LEKGATVVFACRDEKRTLSAISNTIKPFHHSRTIFIRCDSSDFKSIENFCEVFKKKFNSFDILINNAGAMFNKFEKVKTGMEMSLATNHFGGMYLTLLLIKSINPQGRVINVGSSLLKNFEFNADVLLKDLNFEETQNKYDFVKQYSLSKQMQYAFTKFLSSNDFKNKFNFLKFKSVCLHPGVIITDAQSKFKGFWMNLAIFLVMPVWYLFTKSIYYGAQTTVYCALEDYDRLENGRYYSDCALANLPPFLEDENYNKEMLKYIHGLFNKYHYIKNSPEEVNDLVEFMKEYYQK
jgi:NAD(P)-dependent dehydrogenase (short-subunit alcohol dehydrogenase family)